MAMSKGQKRALSPLTSQMGIIKALGTSKEYLAGMLMEPKRSLAWSLQDQDCDVLIAWTELKK